MRRFIFAAILAMTTAVAAFGQGAEAQAKAEQILKQARAAIGDESKLKGLQSLSATGTSRQTFGERQVESEIEIEMITPDKIKRTTTSQFGTMINALNGDQLWNDFIPSMALGGGGGGGGFARMGGGGPGGGGNSPLAAYMQQQQRRELVQVMLAWVLLAPPSTQMQFAFAGEAPGPEGSKLNVINGKAADGWNVLLYFDQQSHRLIGMSYKAKQGRRQFGRGGGPGGAGPGGGQGGGQRQPQAGQGQPGQPGQPPQITPEERERRMKEAIEAFEKSPEIDYRWAFDDYKSVSGLNLPHRLTKIEGGTPNEEWEISKFKINPKLTPDKFVRKEREKTN